MQFFGITLPNMFLCVLLFVLLFLIWFFMYILCDVFLFVITLPDCFSICIGWITLYMFSKRIQHFQWLFVMLMEGSKALNIYPKRHCNRCVAGIYSTYSTAENIFVFRFLQLSQCVFLRFLIYGYRNPICLSIVFVPLVFCFLFFKYSISTFGAS